MLAHSPMLIPLCFQAREPKAKLRVDNINVSLVPEKIGNPNGMQVTFDHDGHTRNLFVYGEDGKVGVNVVASKMVISTHPRTDQFFIMNIYIENFYVSF